jgi:membrane-bound lytic murein transglycosylase D
VRSKTTSANSILLISLALSGCGSVPTASIEEPQEAPAAPVVAPAPRTSVLETLVSDARRRTAVEQSPAPALDDQDAAIEPVLTTVPMTPNRVVERTINDFLQNRRNLLRGWVARGQTYFPMIEQIFDEEDVPDELKYLALSESGLNPTAGSPAGAMGMWQFMPLTGRSEGLRVDSWVDERRDPELSTRAAARHLKALNEDYEGRWHLSVAGYNCSYRCISRAVTKSGFTMEDPPSYWDVYTHLPKETRDFVPNYIATALIVSNPELYGIYVEDLGQELAYDVVHIQGMLSLQEAARLSGSDMATLRALNPALLKNTLPPGEQPYALKIPLGSFERFAANFAKEAPKGGAAVPGGEYVVKSGDTLGKIAKAYKTSVAELQAANGLNDTRININQKLQIPGEGGLVAGISLLNSERQFVSYGEPQFRPIKLADEFQLVHQSGSTPNTPLLAVSLNMNAVEADEGVQSLVPTIYRVQRGDTLGAIAQRFGVSVSSIQAGNRLDGTRIFPNQELTIHSATNIVDPPQPGTAQYQVQHGDSLYEIARRFGMSVDTLKQLNGLNDNMIRPGQNLQVN